MSERTFHSGARGFSLIELLAAAVILGILATVAVPVIETTVRRERERQLRTALRDIRQAIDAYKRAADAGKIVVKSDESGYPPSLGDLVAGAPYAQAGGGARLYFLRRVPRDPFVTDRSVNAVDSWGKRSFRSPADAPMAGDDVFDVHSMSAQKGMNGVPYREW